MRTTDHLMNDLGGKAPPGEKPHLASPVFTRGGRLAKALSPDFQRPIEFGGLQRPERGFKLFGRQLMRLQLVPDTRKAKPLGPPAHQAANKTLVRQELF